SRVDPTPVSDLSTKVEFQDLDMADKPLTNTPAAGSFSTHLAPTTVSAPPAAALPAPASNSGTPAAPPLGSPHISRAAKIAVPTATMLGQNVSIKGNGMEYAGDVNGAVDRLAEEILRRLEKGRTLVVWAFDASGSLQAERERLSKHIETVYKHITQLD